MFNAKKYKLIEIEACYFIKFWYSIYMTEIDICDESFVTADFWAVVEIV